MKKLILFLILFLIPSFCYASTSYEDMGFYTFIGTDNCSTNGKFVYNLSDGWEPKTGTKNTVYSAKAKGLGFYIKRDLVAGTTYDIKITATSNIFFQAINENAIHFYDVDTDCDASNLHNLDSNTIALVSLSNKASTGNYVSSITIRLTATSTHTNWILFIHNYQNKNITNTNWGIKNMQYKEVDTTGTNAIIENNTINNNNLINNQTQNTQDIIDNQNQNKQELIDNQNRIAEEQKEQNQVCDFIDKNYCSINKKYLNQNGEQVDYNYSCITSYIKIDKNTTVTPKRNISFQSGICYYDDNKTLISCVKINTLTLNQKITNIPTNASYFRSTIYTGGNSDNQPAYNVCKSGNQALVDTFTDDSVPTGNDYFDDFNDMLPSNNTISSLITLPISLYTKVLNSINGTCSAITLGSLYNTNLIMPCINLQQYLGNTLWNTLDLIMSGAFVLVISKKMIKAFHNFTSMKDGDVINND